MADDHHSAGIAVERLHKRLTRVDVKVIGGLVKYQQMWRIAGDKSQSQPRAFTARQGAHLLNRAVAGKAETTQLCPHRARRRALHLDRKSVVKGKSVSVRVDLGGRRIIKKKNTSNSDSQELQRTIDTWSNAETDQRDTEQDY